VCVTARYYPPRDTPDAEIASRLARALGLEHHILEQPASQLQTTRRHHLATNFCTLTPSSYALAVGEWLRQEADVVYDGLGGDVLSAGLFLDAERVRLFAEGRLAELADNLLAGFNGGSGFHERMLAQALPAENQRRLSHDLAARRLVRELERHAGAADPVGSFCFFNRTRRDIALVPFRAYAGVPTVHCPYVDRELFDFLFSLPAEMLLDHTFHKDTLARAFPEWAALPYAEWSVATGGRARRHYRRFTWEIARYCSAGAHARPLRRSYVVPRLARALVDPRYGRWAAWVGPLIVYLDQLQVLGALGG
jgi:hypothetical protein